jgi:hypothetical protein
MNSISPLLTPVPANHPPTTSSSSAPQLSNDSDQFAPIATWSVLSYTSNNTMHTLRAVVDRLGISMPHRRPTKEQLAELLIANSVRYPNANESSQEWADNVQPLNPITVARDNNSNDEAIDTSKRKRVSTDAALARNLHNQLNAGTSSGEDFGSESEGGLSPPVEPPLAGKHKKPRNNNYAQHVDSINSPTLSQITNKLAEHGEQMRQMMNMLLQNNTNKIDTKNNTATHKLSDNANAIRVSSSDGSAPTSVNPTQPLVYSCSNRSCDYKSLIQQEKFCKLHGAPMVAEIVTTTLPPVSALQTANTARGGVGGSGERTAVAWNQVDSSATPWHKTNSNNSNINSDSNIRDSSNSSDHHKYNNSGASGNSITINNNHTSIEPTFPFAQISSFIPEKVIQDARRGKWIPLAKFLPSATAMKDYETTQGLEATAVPFYQLAQALNEANNGAATPAITSAYQMLQAFGAGLIPAACEGNPNRLVDYQLFLLEIMALMQQHQSWQFVLSYVEEVRRSKQAGEASWATHKLAAGNEQGMHQDTWLKQIARFQQQTTKPSNPNYNSTHSANISNNNSQNSNNFRAAETTHSTINNTAREVCRHFSETGSCRFKQNCRYLHEPNTNKRKSNLAITPPIPATPPTTTTKSEQH